MISKFLKAAAVFTAAFLFFHSSPLTAETGKVKYFYYEDTGMWNHIFGNSQAYEIPEQMPSSVIIPHHDITIAQQNSFYKALSQQGSPSVVVLISPDHFEFGKKLITLPKNTEFHVPAGRLTLAKDVEKRLTKNRKLKKYMEISSAPWSGEHGIFVHTPFIAKYFPDAEFLPILLKSFSKDDEFQAYTILSQVLNEILPPDALVIASVDFSHYQIPRMTELHDFVTMNTIQNGEDIKHIEVDSPETLTAAIGFARLRGATEPVLIDRTSTFDFIPDEMVVSTSHQYWGFYKPDQNLLDRYQAKVAGTSQRYSKADYSKKNQTVLIAGSGCVGGGIRNKWEWDRYNESEDKAEILLHDFAGTEARFLEGFDALIFELESGNVYESNLHGTGLFIQAEDFSQIASGDESDVENFLQKTGGKLLPENDGSNQIDMLILNGSDDYGSWIEGNMQVVEKILSLFEVVIFKDETSSVDTIVCLKNQGKICPYNLGVLFSEEGKPVKGSVMCINWYDGKREERFFDYESADGIPPAIHQGEI